MSEFISHAFHDPVAVFTGGLVLATVALAYATYRSATEARRLVQETKNIVAADRESLKINLTLEMSRDFDLNPRFVSMRRSAAASLLSGNWSFEVEEILNYLDTVAVFLKDGAVDRKTVFSLFGRRALTYHHFASGHVAGLRASGFDDVWNDFDKVLVPQVKAQLADRGPKTEEEWKLWLIRETKLPA